MTLDEIMERLRALADTKAAEGMARYGINTANRFGCGSYAGNAAPDPPSLFI